MESCYNGFGYDVQTMLEQQSKEYELAVEIANEFFSDDYITHYGTPRHSGRYPWGSGENPYQHEAWYQARERLRAQGFTETEIAKVMNLSTTVYRARVAIASDEERQKVL